METGFLLLVIPGRDPGIAPIDGVRLDPRINPRIKSGDGDDEETTCAGRKGSRRRRDPDAWWGLSRPTAPCRWCADGRNEPGHDGEDTIHPI